MKVTGKKRWVVLALVSLLGGIMVYVPFLRYNYYDQMIIVFTQFKPIVSASYAHEFIGDIGLWFGIFSVLIYPIGGILADKFSERNLLVIGAVMMGLASFWYGIVPGSIEIMIIHILYGIGTSIFIWSAYLKVVRKMGTDAEQGRMYSTSEFVRAIVGTLIGFFGASLLNKAVFPGTGIDPQVLGQQWQMMLFFNGALFIILAVLIFILVPALMQALFYVSIAYGRTLRQFLLVNCLLPCTVVFTCYAAFGGNAMMSILNGSDLFAQMQQFGDGIATFAFLDTLPLGSVMKWVFIIVAMMTFITFSDSVAYSFPMFLMKKTSTDVSLTKMPKSLNAAVAIFMGVLPMVLFLWAVMTLSIR